MPVLSHKVVRSSGTDVDITLTGVLYEKETLVEIIADPKVYGDCKFLKLTSLMHSVQEGLTLLLFWEGEDNQHALILPIEGRGVLDFGKFGGLENPKNEKTTSRMLLKAVRFRDGDKHFTLSLEFSKQRA